MNKLEKYIYNAVKHNPKVKFFIRNNYQRLLDILPLPEPKSAYPIICRPGFFFGFHDHNPFSFDNKKLLANKFSIPLRMPKIGETLDVGYFEGQDYGSFTKVTETRTWAWHLGCKLQWRGELNQIAFNDHVDGKNVSRVIDLENCKEIILPDSIASISPNGQWAIGYNFQRVEMCMPGYGYKYKIDDPELNLDAPKKNGIHIINISDQKKQLLFSIADVLDVAPEPTMSGAKHYFTHAVFNPSSERFIFLHRWTKGDLTKRWTRLVSSDINGKNIYIFPAKNMVSHIGWKDNNHVIAYCRIPKFDDQYVLFRDQEPENYEVIGQKQFNSDGHPSFDPSKRWIVTDIYPDRRRVQSLVLFDVLNKKRFDIARLPMPKRYQSPSIYKHWSCDLHPRWDRKGSIVCFDATFTGERSLCTIDFGDDLKNYELKYL